jgi:hypothetical protein
MSKTFRKIAITLVAALALGEVGVRMAGLVDFPIYSTDDELGYWIKPNQRGAFMNKNEWAFNDLGMPIERNFQPSAAIDVPLIGNSIIMGGNAYNQKDKVGPLLQGLLGEPFRIWPVAVGGWTNVNEAVFLKRHPQIAKNADLFIWEVMNGGFSRTAPWKSEYVFPRDKPASALWYFTRRNVLPRFIDFEMSELPPTGAVQQSNIDRIDEQLKKLSEASGSKHPGLFFLYPTRAHLEEARSGKEWLPERAAVEALAKKYNLVVLDLSKQPGWTPEHYREGTHPTEEGNRFIAKQLSAALLDLHARNQAQNH